MKSKVCHFPQTFEDRFSPYFTVCIMPLHFYKNKIKLHQTLFPLQREIQRGRFSHFWPLESKKKMFCSRGNRSYCTYSLSWSYFIQMVYLSYCSFHCMLVLVWVLCTIWYDSVHFNTKNVAHECNLFFHVMLFWPRKGFLRTFYFVSKGFFYIFS